MIVEMAAETTQISQAKRSERGAYDAIYSHAYIQLKRLFSEAVTHGT